VGLIVQVVGIVWIRKPNTYSSQLCKAIDRCKSVHENEVTDTNHSRYITSSYTLYIYTF